MTPAGAVRGQPTGRTGGVARGAGLAGAFPASAAAAAGQGGQGGQEGEAVEGAGGAEATATSLQRSPARPRLAGRAPQEPARDPGARWLTLGVGLSTGATADELLALVEEVLAAAGADEPPSRGSGPPLTALATLDRRAPHPALLTLAGRLGLSPLAYPAATLASVPVPHPGRAPGAAVGTPSVAEAAALLAAGSGAELLVPKRGSTPRGRPARATAAVARGVDRPG